MDMGNDKKSFLSKSEISIEDYYSVLMFLKQEYGEDSEPYKFMIPDTAKFNELYDFLFFYMKSVVCYNEAESKIIDFDREQQRILPMVAISYEQAKAYCQWVGVMINRKDSVLNKSHTKSYTWQCNLPEKSDYETLLHSKKVKITQNEPLSPLQMRCTKRRFHVKDGSGYFVNCRCSNYISGLTDNVAEYMQEGMIVESGENNTLKFVTTENCANPTGFRIKLTVVSRNETK
jgi:hypothetical protein